MTGVTDFKQCTFVVVCTSAAIPVLNCTAKHKALLCRLGGDLHGFCAFPACPCGLVLHCHI
jgi:hypothetical protein